jgi:tetratricopeptide (TPR) repeat protein/transcriptional regulator with XRE-family HTH domain
LAEPPVLFGGVLRRLRADAAMTQEELADAAGLSPRAISDLERGIVVMPHKDTVRLLADALHLEGSHRSEFEAVARGRGTADGVAAVRRTLPRDIASFAGRQPELQELESAAAVVADAGGLIAIHAIGGMAGVGKTALAVHAAHRLADKFPGGQIFLPLHGHTPGRPPVSPADALATLLMVVGVPVAQVPAGLEARTGLWRDRVAARQLLLVLDDAADSEQVRPLLPGTGGSLVLVTSRRRLSALEDARTINLDTLPPDDGIGLLVGLAARPALSPADPAVAELARLCGFLPLAIGMLARQLHHHPAWTAAGRANELAGAVSRLELLANENVSVAAAFDLSFADLTRVHQRLFCRLGLHPGAEVDVHAAAALDGTDLAAARRGLEALYDVYLLTEPAPGRYRMHDLIREHARDLSGRVDPEDDRASAVGRLLDYYQNTAARADALLARNAGAAAAATGSATPSALPVLTDREEALAWVRAERPNLLACLDQVTAAGQHARIIALTAGTAGLIRTDGPWAEAITRNTTAVDAARQLGDRSAEADAMTNLARAWLLTGDHPAAASGLTESLGIYRDLGDGPGQASALIHLGILGRLTGDYPGAERDLQQALSIYRQLGDRVGEADALANLGTMRFVASDLRGAVRDLQEALVVHRQVGNRRGLADALASLGYALVLTGNYPAAGPHLQEALDIHRDTGNRLGQGNALTFLGDLRRRAGDYPGAARDLAAALSMYRDLGSRSGQANVLLQQAILSRLTGDDQAAARDLQEALDIYRDLGSRSGEIEALNEAGTQRRSRGDLDQASAFHHQALDLARQTDSCCDEAHALAGLGRCAWVSGRAGEAETRLRQALEIFQRAGSADAADVSAELRALPHAPGPALTSP